MLALGTSTLHRSTNYSCDQATCRRRRRIKARRAPQAAIRAWQSSTNDRTRHRYHVNGGVRSTRLVGGADEVVLRRHGVGTSAGICVGSRDCAPRGGERRTAQGSAGKELVRGTEEG